MEADGAHGRDADGQHRVAGGEEAQQLVRRKLEQAEADEHDALCVAHGQLDGLFDAVGITGAVVVADDGHHAVVHAEDGHEDEALELEVDAEDGDRRGREGHQDLVHEEGHHAADALHGDAGQADDIDALDGFCTGAEAVPADLDVGVLLQVEEDGGTGTAELADDRGHCRAGGAGQGLTAVAEDEDGVEHDVHDGADELAAHAQVGAAGRGQQLFAHGLQEQAQTEHGTDGQVADALLGDLHITGLRIEIRLHAGQADDEKCSKAAQRQEDAVFSRLVGALLVFFTQALGQQGVDADAGADTDGDHHVLQREGQRNGGQRTFADVRDEDGVHDIIKRLDQHRDHHRDAQLDEQRVDGHGAHDVFLGGGGIGLLVFHDFSF